MDTFLVLVWKGTSYFCSIAPDLHQVCCDLCQFPCINQLLNGLGTFSVSRTKAVAMNIWCQELYFLLLLFFFFIALLWQKWIFALTDQVVAACPAHHTCTFPFHFYLQFSRTLNFSSFSSWPSSVALRERWVPFLTGFAIELPWAQWLSCALPGHRGMNSPCFMARWAFFICSRDRGMPTRQSHFWGCTRIHSVWDTLWLFYFFVLNQYMKEPHSSDL